MKWFKHESTAIKDEKIQSLIEEFGPVGYMVFFCIVELCAEKLDANLNPEIRASWSYVEHLLRLRRSTVRRVLTACATRTLLIDNSDGRELICSIPKLLLRIDNWTKRSVVTTEQLPTQEEEEEEVEKEKEKEKESGFRASRPTADQINNYFKELNSTALEAERFFDHFESNGWKVGGRTTMKDWKAAARNWCRNSHKFESSKKKEFRGAQDVIETMDKIRKELQL